MNRKNNKSSLLLLGIAASLIACSDSGTDPTNNVEPTGSAPVTSQVPTAPTQPVTVKELNLTLPLPTAEQLQSADFSEHAKLPNLFSDNNKSENMTVDAKVLNDANNPDYIDSLDGAEVSVEVKLP